MTSVGHTTRSLINYYGQGLKTVVGKLSHLQAKNFLTGFCPQQFHI